LALAAAAKQAAFLHHAAAAAAADQVGTRVTLSDAAAAEQGRCELARRRLHEAGADPLAAMAPAMRALSVFDAGTASTQWWERTLTSHLAHGMAVDFQRALAAGAGPAFAGVFQGLLEDCAAADYQRAILVNAVHHDPRLADRLSLWGRRVAGDALGVVGRLLSEAAAFPRLLGHPAADAAAAAVFPDLTAAHARRMREIGLAA
jgi:hypothetical protein